MGYQRLQVRDVREVADAQNNLLRARRLKAGDHEKHKECARACTAELMGKLHANPSATEKVTGHSGSCAYPGVPFT
jgi:hypothetical protein